VLADRTRRRSLLVTHGRNSRIYVQALQHGRRFLSALPSWYAGARESACASRHAEGKPEFSSLSFFVPFDGRVDDGRHIRRVFFDFFKKGFVIGMCCFFIVCNKSLVRHLV
jgi:hypothetical protein